MKLARDLLATAVILIGLGWMIHTTFTSHSYLGVFGSLAVIFVGREILFWDEPRSD